MESNNKNNREQKNNKPIIIDKNISISTKNIKIKKNKISKNIKIIYFILILIIIFLLFFFIKFYFLSESKSKSLNKIIKAHRLLDNENEYNSFASRTSSNYIHYLIDSKDYYEDLFKSLMEAKETIYFSAFRTDPEFFLRRPVDENIYKDMFKKGILTKDFGENITRFMDILNYKAKQNVKIYILVYYEWAKGHITDSKHFEQTINSLNKNINFIRFPKNSEEKYWTNHEKFVVIDKIIGYIGGIDLSWGKYDTIEHPLYEGPNKDNIYEFPLIDYANERITKSFDVANYINPSISRKNQNRLPWHDIQMKIIGPSVNDLTKHFFERWNFAVTCENEKDGKFSFKEISDKIDKDNFWKTISNFFVKNDSNEKNYFVKRDENINKKLENEIYSKYKKIGNFNSDALVLRSASSWNIGSKETEKSILNAYYDLIENAKHFIYIENQFFISKAWTEQEKINVNDNSRDIIKNKVTYYIRKRIEKAYENNEIFKVYIVTSIFPNIGVDFEDNYSIMKIEPLVKLIYKTISQNNGLSLIEQLQKKMGDKWKNYLGIYGLRTHGLINGVPKTEMVYLHSKLLIVDDTKVLIGSPNLNDRSLLGDRDSEIAILVEEKKEDNFVMNGKKYQAAKLAVELRKNLLAEFLGIDMNDPILKDPVSDEMFNFINSRARNNTEIYRNLFGCFPDDTYTTYQMYINEKKRRKEEEKEWPDVVLNKYMKQRNEIKGFIVEFSQNFLKDEKFNKNKIFPEYAYA